MLSRTAFLTFVLLMAATLWSQDDAAATAPASTPDTSQMSVPPPVSAESYPTATGSEGRSNYLRTGLTFSSSYSDNILGGVTPNPKGDASYSIWPYIELDETTSRLHSLLTFNPGFTFYQHTSERNEADENLGLNMSYRLSPHTTLILVDTFNKSSNLLNQPNSFQDAAFGSAQVSPVNVLPPVADELTNTGMAQISYQFGPNAMVGFGGTFTNLHYPNPAEVPGLYDSSSRGGSAFYSRRLSGKHYIGVTYQYQDLLAYPIGFTAETKTNGVMGFYTIYLKSTFSLSFFGGPQYSDTRESVFPSQRAWSPAAGSSVAWQGQKTNFSVSYSRMIAPGGGLVGAVHQDAATTLLRRQLSQNLTIGMQAQYGNNRLLSPVLVQAFGGGFTSGHSISGTLSAERQLGEHFSLGLGYSRLHQSYNNIQAVSSAPDTDRGWISISYQFARPLGR